MVTGQDLVHKMLGKDDVCGLTWDLITCSDGREFGKTEGNAIFLDPNRTSPYQFAQYWINTTDADAEAFIKKFTLIPLDEIDRMIQKHRENPSARYLQKELAKYMTCLVHSEEEYNKAMEATDILFGKGTMADMKKLDEKTFLAAMNGVPTVEIKKEDFGSGITVVDLAAMHDKVTSKSEARKLIKSNGFSINKVKVTNEKDTVTESALIASKYLLLLKGRKDYTLVTVK
jgi:tyrosyl-tRNA synthetase